MSAWLDFRLNAASPIIIGHRGAPEHVLENTYESFKHALDRGAQSIEADVRLTSDRHVVCLHDPDLLRVAGASARIDGLSLADARKLFPALLALDDLLRLTAGHPIILDLKCTASDDIDRIVETCQVQDALDRILLTTHDVGSGHVVRKRSSTVAIGAFFDTGAGAFEVAGDFGASWIRVLPRDYQAKTIETVRDAGFRTVAVTAPLSSFRTVADERALSEIHAIGIDAVITDDPELAVRHFREASLVAAG